MMIQAIQAHTCTYVQINTICSNLLIHTHIDRYIHIYVYIKENTLTVTNMAEIYCRLEMDMADDDIRRQIKTHKLARWENTGSWLRY